MKIEPFIARRYVYANDIVPQVPPTESGRFEHFGREYQCDPPWRMYQELSQLRQSMNAAPHIEPTGAEQFPAAPTTNGAHADGATARRLPTRPTG
jgi:hypothetical protein